MKTKTSNPATLARVTAALQQQGISLFRCESGYSDHDAKRNLQGRTHYVDDDTLRYFKTRILSAGRSTDGLIYWLIESVNSRPDHGGFNKRAVAFDVFGTVINDRAGADGQGWHRTSDAAAKELAAFLATIDPAAHTRDTLAEKARYDIETAKRTLAALKGKEPVYRSKPWNADKKPAIPA